jgi:VanZ family protein
MPQARRFSSLRSTLHKLYSPLHRQGLRHPFLYYTLPLLTVALGIAAGSLAPPSALPDAITSLSDKLLHASAYASFGFLLVRGWTREDPPTRGVFLRCALIAFAFGFYLEVLQSFTPERSFAFSDVFANALGITFGLILWQARHGMRFAPSPEAPAMVPTAPSVASK